MPPQNIHAYLNKLVSDYLVKSESASGFVICKMLPSPAHSPDPPGAYNSPWMHKRTHTRKCPEF